MGRGSKFVKVYLVVSFGDGSREHVESVWLDEDTANSVAEEMKDEYFDFYVKEYDVLDAK